MIYWIFTGLLTGFHGIWLKCGQKLLDPLLADPIYPAPNLPRKQNIGVRTLNFKNLKLERNADYFGRDFWGELGAGGGGGGLEPWRNKAKKSAEKKLPKNSL